jgi:hypothetical protein
VEVGYTFNKPGIKRAIGISSVRLFANAQNVITWDRVGGTFDPEIPSGNGAVYPQQRIINFGASIDF